MHGRVRGWVGSPARPAVSMRRRRARVPPRREGDRPGLPRAIPASPASSAAVEAASRAARPPRRVARGAGRASRQSLLFAAATSSTSPSASCSASRSSASAVRRSSSYPRTSESRISARARSGPGSSRQHTCSSSSRAAPAVTALEDAKAAFIVRAGDVAAVLRWRQPRGPLVELGRGRRRAARLRPPCRVLERARHRLVGSPSRRAPGGGRAPRGRDAGGDAAAWSSRRVGRRPAA